MDKEEFSVQTGGFSPRSIGRGTVLFLLPISAYILGLLPVIFFYVFITRHDYVEEGKTGFCHCSGMDR